MWAKLKQQMWQWRGILLAVPNVTALVLGIRWTGLLQLLELAALDHMFILRPRETVDSRIVIVEITEPDLSKLGQWPMSDAVLARVLENLKQQQPRAIGLDLYRDLPVNPGHEALVKIFKTTPNLIGVERVSQKAQNFLVEAPPELKRLQQVGANDLPVDGDGKIRRGLLYLNLPNNVIIESFALKLALLYLKAEGITDQPADTNPNYLQLGKGVFPIFEANDGGYVHADAGSYQVLINYRGKINRFPRVSLADVLENRIPSGLMRGKIVLIGSTAESLKDLFLTPYSSAFSEPELMAGVTIHANLISQILSAAIDDRPGIKTLPEPLEWLWVLLWSIVGATLCWQQRHSSQTKKIPLMMLLAGSCLLGSSYLAFLFAWWIPVLPPLMALGWSAIAVIQYFAHNAAQMRQTFGRYLTDEVVANLLETPSGLKLGGERKRVTVLVSDLRGFSAISEQLPPEQVVKILNLYLEAMTDVINQYQGTINEFMGDGIFVLFGAPIHRDDDSRRAIACAVAMQLAMQQVNQQIQQMNLPRLEMGIGINTGEVFAGNIGSQKRAQYTVIGSHVNLATRIETYTVGGQILISEYTKKDAHTQLRIDGELRVEPKGMKEPITLYEIGGIGGDYDIFLPKNAELMVDLAQEITVEYVILQGKHAGGERFPGKLVSLSENSAKLRSPQVLEALANIKLKLLTELELPPGEEYLYAKVIKKSPVDEYHVLIRFTNVPPKVNILLNTLRQQTTL